MHLLQNLESRLYYTLRVGALALVCLLPLVANAVPGTFTWTGGGGNNLWTNPDNWAASPAIDHEPSGFPNAADHDVVISAGAGAIVIGAADSVRCQHLNQDAGGLTVNGRLKIFGNYNLNFPTLTAGAGAITLAGNALTGTGTTFGTDVVPGALLFTSTKTLIGYVAAVTSSTAATLVQMSGLNPSPIPVSSSYQLISPSYTSQGSAIINTNVSGELPNVVTGGPFTPDMCGRVIMTGLVAIGVVMSYESSTRIRLTSAALATRTASTFLLSQPISEVGTGTLACGPGSRVSFLGNTSQNIPAKSYAQLFIEDSRTSGYTDIFKGAYVSGSDINVSEQLRQKAQVRLSSALGARMVLAGNSTHMTWIGDNNSTTAWPMATYATTEFNPFSLVYSSLVDRYILHMANTTAYNAVDFTHADTRYRNLTFIGSQQFSTIVFPVRSVIVVNGDLTIGTVNSWPVGFGSTPNRRMTLGDPSGSSASANAVTFTLVGNYAKVGGGGLIARDGSVGYNRSRLRIRGTGALNQAFLDEIAAPSGLRLTELNINRSGMTNNYPGDADTYDITSGTVTLTGTTRACDNVAIRGGGATPPTLNIGCTAFTIGTILAQEAGTVASTLPNGAISLGGTWLQNGGTFSGGTSALTMTGFAAQNFTVNTAASCTLHRWIINKLFNSVTLNTGTVRVTGEISLPSGNNGTLACGASANIVLASTATGTARVSRIFGGSITGNITVERYIPVTGATLTNYWMELGSTVTGASADDFVGLNATVAPTPAVNFYTYNERDTTSFVSGNVRYNWNGWKQVTSLSAGLMQGRGFRAKANAALLSGNRTFSVKGPLVRGDINTSVSRTNPGGYNGGGWNFIANPYACPIDFTSSSLGKPAGMNNAFWVWESQQQRYRVFVGPSGSDLGSVALNASALGGANLIAGGQGFWIKLISGSDDFLVFREAAKANSEATFYREGEGTTGFVKLTLQQANGQADEAALRFNARTTLGFDAFADARKLRGNGPNVSLLPDSALELAVHTQQEPVGQQRIPLRIGGQSVGAYSLTFTGFDTGLPIQMSLSLRDKVAQRVMPLTEGTRYSFTLSVADLASPASRFELLLEPSLVVASTKEMSLGLAISPNPAKTQFRLSTTTKATPTQIWVRDMAGNVVASYPWPTGDTSLDVAVAEWPKGVYVVEVMCETGLAQKRLVVE